MMEDRRSENAQAVCICTPGDEHGRTIVALSLNKTDDLGMLAGFDQQKVYPRR